MWILNRILEKVFSGRFVLTVSFGLTYCLSVLWIIYLVTIGKMELNTFLGIFSGFAAATGSIVASYFGRQDRESNKNKEKT